MVHMRQSIWVWDRFPLYYFEARHGRLPLHAELWVFYSSELRFGPKGYLLYFLFPFSLFSTWLFLLVPCFWIPGRSLWTDLMSTFVPLPAPSWENRKPPLLFLLQLAPLLLPQGLMWRTASAGLVSIVIVSLFSQVLSVSGSAWVVCLTAHSQSFKATTAVCLVSSSVHRTFQDWNAFSSPSTILVATRTHRLVHIRQWGMAFCTLWWGKIGTLTFSSRTLHSQTTWLWLRISSALVGCVCSPLHEEA